MAIAVRVITGITVLLALLVGLIGLFGLLVALNGYDGATGGRILVGFLIAMLISLAGVGWGTYRMLGSALARTGRSIWLIGPIGMAIALIGFTAALIIAATALILILG